jgi:hypothetical protein
MPKFQIEALTHKRIFDLSRDGVVDDGYQESSLCEIDAYSMGETLIGVVGK